MIQIGSLFSGIGGLELGLEWAFESAGIEHETVFQVEQDPFCLQVLDRHWPGVRKYTDVKTFNGSAYAPDAPAGGIDILCGGFPCQDVSSAGKRAGLAGDRSGLWFEFDRLVGEIRPRIVVVENVASGAALWVDHVRSDLERDGYTSLPIPLEARHVGALHRRSRVFVIAWATHTHERTQRAVSGLAEVAGPQTASGTLATHADGSRPTRGGAQPGPAWMAGQPFPVGAATDADSAALRHGAEWGPGGRPDGVRDEREPFAAFPSWGSAEPELVRMVHGLSGWLDGRRATGRAEARRSAKRRHALGNSVVPQCAEVVGHVLIEMGLI